MALLSAAIVVAFAFNLTNGFHDASNAVATMVVTRAARPASAIVLAGAGNLLGPLVSGTAVADTVGGIVSTRSEVVPVAGAALTAALLWNVVTWRLGLPSSSSHALVGGLCGPAIAVAGVGAVRWGGMNGIHPVGVLGVLVALTVSPLLGFAAGFAAIRSARRVLRRATRAVEPWFLRGEWVGGGLLAFSHGANDAQKSMGVVTLLLLATGHLTTFAVPLWVTLASAGTLTLGTCLGGWRIARTIGRDIYRIRPLDGLASQSASAAVILAASALGGPVSTTHVVASSVAGVGSGRRWGHVRWAVVREMAGAWVVTIPTTAALGIAALPAWRAFA